ncbi:MAG: CPBP family intramembrane glutamic endopeptidase [Planctomycetales bacterium]
MVRGICGRWPEAGGAYVLSLQRGTDFHWGGLWLPGVWVNVLIGSPLAEEILYRGVVYRVLRRSRSRIVSAVISAAWFAVVHLPWWGQPKPPLEVAIQTGLFLCMGSRSRCWWSFPGRWGIDLHVANNLFFVLVANPK